MATRNVNPRLNTFIDFFRMDEFISKYDSLGLVDYWACYQNNLTHILTTLLGVVFYRCSIGHHFFFFSSRIDELTLNCRYPPDYTLQVLSCLQGISHAFLLPFGQSKASLLHGMASGAATAASNWSTRTNAANVASSVSTSQSPVNRSKTGSIATGISKG